MHRSHCPPCLFPRPAPQNGIEVTPQVLKVLRRAAPTRRAGSVQVSGWPAPALTGVVYESFSAFLVFDFALTAWTTKSPRTSSRKWLWWQPATACHRVPWSRRLPRHPPLPLWGETRSHRRARPPPEERTPHCALQLLAPQSPQRRPTASSSISSATTSSYSSAPHTPLPLPRERDLCSSLFQSEPPPQKGLWHGRE